MKRYTIVSAAIVVVVGVLYHVFVFITNKGIGFQLFVY